MQTPPQPLLCYLTWAGLLAAPGSPSTGNCAKSWQGKPAMQYCMAAEKNQAAVQLSTDNLHVIFN